MRFNAHIAKKESLRAGLRRAALALGGALLTLGLGLTTSAQAQDLCARVHAELAALHNGGGGGRNAQLQQSINQQAGELARARGAFDRYQCAFGASPQCGNIVAAINQMQANIDQMQRQLARSGGGANAARIAELERVFATRCGPSQQQVQQALTPGNLLAAIFGVRSQPQARMRVYDQSSVIIPGQNGFDRPGDFLRDPWMGAYGNTYRTMCVRTTDGFYWPISFSTTRDRFDEDRSLCAAMCPGTAVELFAYRNPGEQIDAMINTLTAEPYTDQEYAFSYRESFDPNNRCQPSSAALAELRSVGDFSLGPVGPTVPQPTPRPHMASDPETRALQDGGVTFAALGQMTRPQEEGQQLVRVVGPAYGYFAN